MGDKARSLEGLDVPTEISRPALKKKVTDPVEKASLELLKEGKVERNPYLKLNEQISDLISTGKVNTDEWLKILKKIKSMKKILQDSILIMLQMLEEHYNLYLQYKDN